MASSFTNVLSPSDIAYIQQLPEVVEAKSRVDATNSGMIYFTITLTDSIRSALATRFGLDLTTVHTIPMRWVKGDTAPHVDVGSARFDHTHLVYLSDSAGALVIDGTEYPIQENTGYVFAEGMSHATCNTGAIPRLVLGPMSNQAFRVGGPNTNIYYYSGVPPTSDNSLGRNYDNYVLGDVSDGEIGSYNRWIVDSELSRGIFVLGQEYDNGHVFSGIDGNGDRAYYYVYAVQEEPTTTTTTLPSPLPCFVSGTRILTPTGYKKVEEIETGDNIITSDSRNVKVSMYRFTIASTTAETAPYTIQAGALGNYLPSRDLHISGNHAIQDSTGVWQIPKFLANKNPQIQQHALGESVTYYHVACENYCKDNLIAEGVTAESYNERRQPVVWKRSASGYVRRQKEDLHVRMHLR